MPNIRSAICAIYIFLFLKFSAHVESSGISEPSTPTHRERLRGSARTESRRLRAEPLLCRITILHTQLYAKDGELPEDDTEVSCIPIINGKESDRLYRIELPDDFLAGNLDAIESGSFYLSLDQAVVTSNRVVFRKSATFKAMSFPSLRDGEVDSKTIGTKTVAALRISTLDVIPTFSSLELEDKLAGRNGLNMLTQYKICSFGKLQFTLAKEGVMEFQLNNTLSDFDGPDTLVEAVQQQFSVKQNYSLSELADVVLLCLPPGTLREGKPWVASAPIGHWRAQFNDKFCLSLSTAMHEVGHLLGLTHSNKNGVEYNDTVGYMGFGLPSTTYPQKCFNAAKHAQLGWFADRTQKVDPINDGPVQVQLAAFTDYDITTVDKPVLVNIVDQYFIQYNMAKKFNFQTGDRVNQSAIVEKQSSGSSSLAGLDVGEDYTISNFSGTGRSLVIAACGKQEGSTNSPDVMYISISLDKSACTAESASEIIPPSLNSTSSPSQPPSQSPVVVPSSQPTEISTGPTHSPSKRPITSSPTKVAPKPSAAPSTSATIEPPVSRATGKTPSPSDATAAQLTTNAPTAKPSVTPVIKPTSQPTNFEMFEANATETKVPRNELTQPSPTTASSNIDGRPTMSPTTNLAVTEPSRTPSGKTSDGPTSVGGDGITKPPSGPLEKQVTAPTFAPSQIKKAPATTRPNRPSKAEPHSPSTIPPSIPVSEPTLKNCDANLIENANMEKRFDLYWTSNGEGRLSVDRGVNGTKAFRLAGRKSFSDSAMYRSSEHLDYSCLTPGSAFEVNADFKLYDRVNERFTTCNTDETCPQVRFSLRDAERDVVLKEKLRGYTSEWEANKFNHFRQILTFPSDWDGTITSFKIEIRGFNPEWDLIVDNFDFKRVESGTVAVSSN